MIDSATSAAARGNLRIALHEILDVLHHAGGDPCRLQP